MPRLATGKPDRRGLPEVGADTPERPFELRATEIVGARAPGTDLGGAARGEADRHPGQLLPPGRPFPSGCTASAENRAGARKETHPLDPVREPDHRAAGGVAGAWTRTPARRPGCCPYRPRGIARRSSSCTGTGPAAGSTVSTWHAPVGTINPSSFWIRTVSTVKRAHRPSRPSQERTSMRYARCAARALPARRLLQRRCAGLRNGPPVGRGRRAGRVPGPGQPVGARPAEPPADGL